MMPAADPIVPTLAALDETPVSLADFGAAVAAAQTDAVAQKLADGRTQLKVLEMAEDATARATLLSEQSPEKDRWACCAGCSFCCRLAVSITPPEALLVAERLWETRSPAELADARERISATSERVSHLTIEERAAVRVACALLTEEGACSIYAFRPLGCRGWTSFSRAACEQAFNAAQPGHDGPADRVAHTAAGAVTEGLERGLRAAGIDARHYEFHGAVLRALDTPDVAERWARGEDVFTGCARVTSRLLERR